MIVSHSLRYVYIGPPKTGSTTMHKWLAQPALFDPARDMDTSTTGHQHNCDIPESARDYFIFVSTRERAAWLDSLWRQSRNDAVDYDDGTHPLLTWQQFQGWRRTCGNPFYTRELIQYWPERVDLFIDCDRLDTEIQKLPFYSSLRNTLKPLVHWNANSRTPQNFEECKR
jgi:hypothetical protein